MVANNLIYMFFHKKHRFDSFGQFILENINISTLEIEQKQRKSQKKKKKKKNVFAPVSINIGKLPWNA